MLIQWSKPTKWTFILCHCCLCVYSPWPPRLLQHPPTRNDRLDLCHGLSGSFLNSLCLQFTSANYFGNRWRQLERFCIANSMNGNWWLHGNQTPSGHFLFHPYAGHCLSSRLCSALAAHPASGLWSLVTGWMLEERRNQPISPQPLCFRECFLRVFISPQSRCFWAAPTMARAPSSILGLQTQLLILSLLRDSRACHHGWSLGYLTISTCVAPYLFHCLWNKFLPKLPIWNTQSDFVFCWDPG